MEKVISRKKRKSVADRIFVVCNTIFMILFVAITLYPVINTLAISFNDGTDALRGGIYLWPRKFTLKNYITVLQKDSLVTGAIISVLRTVIGTLFALVANARTETLRSPDGNLELSFSLDEKGSPRYSLTYSGPLKPIAQKCALP